MTATPSTRRDDALHQRRPRLRGRGAVAGGRLRLGGGGAMILPLFPFYGSKWRDARRYPAPHNGHVIEPFAGSAGYSLWHAPPRVTLCDVDPIIVGVWRYLIAVSERELRALPDLEPGQCVDDLGLCQEARWLIGFWLNRGSAQPKKTRTAYS